MHNIWDTLGTWQMFYIIRQLKQLMWVRWSWENEQRKERGESKREFTSAPGRQQGRRVGSGRLTLEEGGPGDRDHRDLGDEGVGMLARQSGGYW